MRPLWTIQFSPLVMLLMNTVIVLLYSLSMFKDQCINYDASVKHSNGIASCGSSSQLYIHYIITCSTSKPYNNFRVSLEFIFILMGLRNTFLIHADHCHWQCLTFSTLMYSHSSREVLIVLSLVCIFLYSWLVNASFSRNKNKIRITSTHPTAPTSPTVKWVDGRIFFSSLICPLFQKYSCIIWFSRSESVFYFQPERPIVSWHLLQKFVEQEAVTQQRVWHEQPCDHLW